MQNKLLMCTVPFMTGVRNEDNHRQALEVINRRLTDEIGEVVNIETITITTLFGRREVGLRMWYRIAVGG